MQSNAGMPNVMFKEPDIKKNYLVTEVLEQIEFYADVNQPSSWDTGIA